MQRIRVRIAAEHDAAKRQIMALRLWSNIRPLVLAAGVNGHAQALVEYLEGELAP